jgi:hypothetical protein
LRRILADQVRLCKIIHGQIMERMGHGCENDFAVHYFETFPVIKMMILNLLDACG